MLVFLDPNPYSFQFFSVYCLFIYSFLQDSSVFCLVLSFGNLWLLWEMFCSECDHQLTSKPTGRLKLMFLFFFLVVTGCNPNALLGWHMWPVSVDCCCENTVRHVHASTSDTGPMLAAVSACCSKDGHR